METWYRHADDAGVLAAMEVDHEAA